MVQRVGGSLAGDSVLRVAATSDPTPSDVLAGSDGNCGSEETAMDTELKSVELTSSDVQKRISTLKSKPVDQSLPFLPTYSTALPSSVIHCTPSVSCCGFALKTLPNRVSTSGEIVSSEISSVVVKDSGILPQVNLNMSDTEMVGELSSSVEIPSSRISSLIVDESGISGMSSSQMNLRISDSETVGDMNVMFEPVCRICQLPVEGQMEVGPPLVSPCRCTGSLQYTHITCLVVSWLCVHRISNRGRGLSQTGESCHI